jgi:hypothetical protein
LQKISAIQSRLGGLGITVGSGGGGSSPLSNPANMPMNNPSINAANDAALREAGMPTSDVKTINPFGTNDSGGLNIGKGFMLKNVVEPERVLSPSQTQAFELLVAQLPHMTSVFDKVFSGMTPNIPNFNRGGNSSSATDNSVNIDSVTVVANDVSSMLSQLKRIVRSKS